MLRLELVFGADVSVVDSLQVNNLLSFSSYEVADAKRAFNLKIIDERLELMRRAGVVLHIQLIYCSLAQSRYLQF